MKKVLAVARQVPPCQVLDLLYEYSKTEYSMRTYTGWGKPFAAPLEEMLRAVAAAEIILLGLSPAHEAAEEMAVVREAYRLGKLYGFYGSTAQLPLDLYTDEIKRKTAFFFVIDEEGAGFAQAFFPKANITVIGNTAGEARRRRGPSAGVQKMIAVLKNLAPG